MTQDSQQRQRPWYRRPLWIGGALSALAVSFLAGGAFGQGVRPGGGCWLGSGHFARFGHHGERFALPDKETAREHVQAGAAWLLRAVDASEEQRTRVNGILDPLTGDLLDLVAQHRSGHSAFLEALAARRWTGRAYKKSARRRSPSSTRPRSGSSGRSAISPRRSPLSSAPS